MPVLATGDGDKREVYKHDKRVFTHLVCERSISFIFCSEGLAYKHADNVK